MSTWILHGGPKHLTTGIEAETVPAGYEFEGRGSDYSHIYPDGTREAAAVYRWAEDLRYIRDGQKILQNITDGAYAAPANVASLLSASMGMAADTFRHGISAISVEPLSDDAAAARQSIDQFRGAGLI